MQNQNSRRRQTPRRARPKPPDLSREHDALARLMALDDHLGAVVAEAMDRAFIAGANPGELLTCLQVVFLRSVDRYPDGSALPDLLGAGRSYYQRIYRQAEVV